VTARILTLLAGALSAASAGAQTAAMTLRMPPCGAIAGVVVNEKGEPVADVEIVALRHSNGAWTWRPPATPETPPKTYTNSRGEFRIANLTAGRYFLRAAAPKTAGPAYPAVFYPRSLGPDGAASVPVLNGATTPANFALQPGPAFRVAGRIEGYGPDRVVCLGLVPAGYNASVAQVIGRVSRFGPDGVFAIDAVPPGTYVLSAATCREKLPRSVIVPVVLAGDIDGLRVRLEPGQSLAGFVKGEGVDVAGLKLSLPSRDLSDVYVPGAVAAADGSFVFEHVLEHRPIVDFPALPPGAYVKSVMYGEGALEIVVSARNSSRLRGTVVDRHGNAAAYAMVMALPEDGGPPAKNVTADAYGAFEFPVLRPGTYKTLAWESPIHPLAVEMDDPALARLLNCTSRTLTLPPDTWASVTLTVTTMADVNLARAAAAIMLPTDNR
jgi:hypothetical protein